MASNLLYTRNIFSTEEKELLAGEPIFLVQSSSERTESKDPASFYNLGFDLPDADPDSGVFSAVAMSPGTYWVQAFVRGVDVEAAFYPDGLKAPERRHVVCRSFASPAAATGLLRVPNLDEAALRFELARESPPLDPRALKEMSAGSFNFCVWQIA